ncbi:MAG: glycosyltransferase family 39 protein, partial [Thaumarchaeota archaeon]|nr:glycosyltransferase family 39 protein [Nitrososphaerota archaeon]
GHSLLAPSFGGTVVSQQARDKYHFIWNFWWLGHSISTGVNPLQTGLMFYPQGTSLVLQTIDYTDGAVSAILSLVAGEVFSFNVIILASFALSGVAAFLLAWHFTRSRLASVIAGFIFAFFPQHVAQAMFGHPNIASVEWLPAYLLCLMLAFEKKSFRYSVLAGVFIAVMTMTDLEWTLMAAFVTGVYLVYHLVTFRLADIRKFLLLAATTLVVGFGVTSPYLVQAYLATASELRPPPAINQVFLNSAVVRLYLTPFPYNAFYGSSFASDFTGLSGGPPNWIIFAGWTVLALAALGAITSKDRRKYFLLALAGLFFLFSLGPSRNPSAISLQLPYTFLYDHIQLLHYMRSSARYSIVMMLSLSVLAAMGAKKLFDVASAKWSRIPAAKIVAVVIMLLLLVEYAPTIGTAAATTNPVDGIIAADHGSFGVLELPETITMTQFYLYQQTLFQKPLVNGKISQVSQTLPDYVYSQPFLRQLSNPVRSAKFSNDIIDQPYNYTQLGPLVLSEYGIKYVVLNTPDFVSTKIFDRVYTALFQALGPPVYQDDDNVLFELPQWTTTASILTRYNTSPLTLFGAGWGPVGSSGRTAANSSQLFVYAASPGARSVTLNATENDVCIANLNFSKTADCGTYDPATNQHQYQISFGHGMNILSLEVPAGSTEVSSLKISH